jgi:hypothetical protein
MKVKETIKLIKCIVVEAGQGWNVGDKIMVNSDDPRIGKQLKEVKE